LTKTSFNRSVQPAIRTQTKYSGNYPSRSSPATTSV